MPNTTHRRFCRWRDQGLWESLLEKLIVESDYEWLMIDASHCKVHPHAAGARGGNQGMSRTKGDSTPEADQLMAGFKMAYLLADKGYDSDAIVAQAEKQGAKAVIPPRKNRKQPREYDKDIYKLRHLVENAFLHLKR